jgi:hypothetical protein
MNLVRESIYGRNIVIKRYTCGNLVLLIAVLAISVTGCSRFKASPADEAAQAFDDVRAEIRATVADPERASQANELITELQEKFIAVSQSIDTRRAKFVELYADYDATQADIDAALDDILAAQRSNQAELSSFQSQLASILTDEEWAAVEKKNSKALSAAIKTLPQSI